MTSVYDLVASIGWKIITSNVLFSLTSFLHWLGCQDLLLQVQTRVASGVWWEFSEGEPVRRTAHFNVTWHTVVVPLLVSTHCKQSIPHVNIGSQIMWKSFKIQFQRPCPSAAPRPAEKSWLSCEGEIFPWSSSFLSLFYFEEEGIWFADRSSLSGIPPRQKVWLCDPLFVGVVSPLPTQDKKVVVWWESVKLWKLCCHANRCVCVCGRGGWWLPPQSSLSLVFNRLCRAVTWPGGKVLGFDEYFFKRLASSVTSPLNFCFSRHDAAY